MAKIKISDKGKKINNNDIKSFEKENNINFPEPYRKFLLKYNGGIPKPNTYLCEENFGINPLTKEKKESELVINYFTDLDGSFLASDILPENIVTIGEDLAGNYFCLSVSGEDKGKIYFCNHDDPDELPYSNLYLIANSFDEFFNGLQEEPRVSNFEKYCEQNDIKNIKKILDEGLDVNTLMIPNHTGTSLLNIAISERKPEIIKLLLQRGANTKKVFWYIFPDQEIFDLLLSKSADINEKNFYGETPIFLAVANRKLEVLKLLIKSGANVFAKDNKGNTALNNRLNEIKNNGGDPNEDEFVKIIKDAMK